MPEILMPVLGADMEEGILLQWRISVGQVVRRMQAVAYIETTKGAVEIEAYVEGVVEELLAVPGDTVPVGTPIARLRPLDGAPAG